MPSTTIPLRNIGLLGLQKDAQEQDIPASGITSGENVRIKDRALQSWSDVIASIEVDDPTETLVFADGIWRDRDILSGIIVILADDTLGEFDDGFEPDEFMVEGLIQVYFYDTAGVRFNISPASPLQTTERWTGSKNGEFYVINNYGLDLPHIWFINDLTPDAITPMPGWPENYRCNFMDTFKNFIVAGGIVKDGITIPGMVKWSHPVSPGDQTFFWAIDDPTILAGELPLVLNIREMTAIQRLKDLMIIYFDLAVVRMSFQGGQFVMDFETIFTDDGAISARSMVEVDGSAFVFGTNDVYAHDGYVKKSISDLRMTNFLESNVAARQPVDAVYWPIYNEVMFLARTPFVTFNTVDADRIYFYNLVHDAWMEVDVTLGGEPAIGLLFRGPNIIEPGVLNLTWDSAITEDTNWDETGNLSWSGSFANRDRVRLYALSARNFTIYDFDAPTGESIFRQKTRIQHTHIDLDEGGQAVGNRIVYVNRVYPQIQGEGTVQFRFGVHRTANSPIDWVNTVQFKINKVDENDPNEEREDYACDVRMAGRYIAYEMTPVDDASFAFSGMDIEIEQVGED